MSSVKKKKVSHKITARAVASDLAFVEDRVDQILDIVKELPTRSEMQNMLDRTFNLTQMKEEHDYMKKIFRERFYEDTFQELVSLQVEQKEFLIAYRKVIDKIS